MEQRALIDRGDFATCTQSTDATVRLPQRQRTCTLKKWGSNDGYMNNPPRKKTEKPFIKGSMVISATGSAYFTTVGSQRTRPESKELTEDPDNDGRSIRMGSTR
ncbi:UNVERIFIED_CONTAM: hypothetical protein Sindi_2255500 [Sesamum indicum]